MFPVFLAALALVGAPASTRVVCDPSIAPMAGPSYIVEGYATTGLIRLNSTPCAGALLASASTAVRVRIQRANPSLYIDGVIGAGLLVILHESVHETGEWNECRTERRAMGLLPNFLRGYERGTHYRAALVAAQQYDESMPPQYHDC